MQYRDKPASPAQRRKRAERLQALCVQHNAALLINDDVELCLAVGAAGVHLGRNDGDIAAAREALGPDRILGATCHDNLAYAKEVSTLGVDYVAFGRLYASKTKPEAPPCPLSRIREAQQAGLTTVGIGGITFAKAPEVLAAGADMLAVIHDLFSHADVEAQAKRYSALFS